MRSMKFTDLFSFESIILTVVLPVGTLLNCERSSCCVQSFHGTWQSNYIMCDELGLFDHSILYHSIKSALSLFTKSLCQNIGFNLHHLMRKGRSPKIEIALNLWDFAQQSFHWIEEKCKIKVAFRPNLCAWWTSIIFAKFPHDPLNMYGWFPENSKHSFLHHESGGVQTRLQPCLSFWSSSSISMKAVMQSPIQGFDDWSFWQREWFQPRIRRKTRACDSQSDGLIADNARISNTSRIFFFTMAESHSCNAANLIEQAMLPLGMPAWAAKHKPWPLLYSFKKFMAFTWTVATTHAATFSGGSGQCACHKEASDDNRSMARIHQWNWIPAPSSILQESYWLSVSVCFFFITDY